MTISSSSSTLGVVNGGESSRLERLADVTEQNIKHYSLKELRAMRDVGKTQTRPDAPEVDMDEDFWRRARIVMPNGKREPHGSDRPAGSPSEPSEPPRKGGNRT